MCGIVGYVGGRPCRDLLVAGLEKLEYRGYDSAGVSVIEDGRVDSVRAVGNLANLRAAAITLTAIPLSLAAAVLVLRAFDATINTMTLGGMAIAIGALVDTRLPVLWRRCEAAGGATAWCGFESGDRWVATIVGWLATAVALSVGASFWFALLKKAFRVREQTRA